MNHIDEQTLELFVLQSGTVEDRRGEIERHLAECHGCRSLAHEIEQFYSDVEIRLREEKGEERSPEKALVRSPRHLEPYYEPYSPPTPYRPPTIVGRFRWIVRRHPIVAGAGGFALAAALAAIMLFRMGSGPRDKNPSHSHINSQSAALEIYNRDNEKLWEVPSGALFQLSLEDYRRWESRVIITDLDGDGINEVIAAVAPDAKTSPILPLVIFSSDGRVRSKRYFRDTVSFRGTPYPEDLTISSLICHDFGNQRGKEIFVLTDGGRSPNTLFRLSVDGTILGKYVHFGTGTIQVVSFPGSDRDQLLFCGQNDADEPDSLSYPVMIVLNPEKITGVTEAGESSGFGLPVSRAEQYIIRFPLTDLNRLFQANGRVGIGSMGSENGAARLEMNIRGSYTNMELGVGEGPAYFYQFNSNFEVLLTKYESATENLRQRLIKEGKIKNTPIKEYLTNLKNGVRYWNGTAWQTEVTTVNQPPTA